MSFTLPRRAASDAARSSFFTPPTVTPTAGPAAWFAAQRTDEAVARGDAWTAGAPLAAPLPIEDDGWTDGAGRGDVRPAGAPDDDGRAPAAA